MKRTIILVAILAAAAMTAAGRGRGRAACGVTVSDLRIELSGADAAIRFSVEVGTAAVGRTSTARLIPVIGAGTDEIRLPEIVVEGRGAALSRRRRGMDAPAGSIVTTNGATVDYAAAVPLSDIKTGSDLRIGFSVEGCCSTITGDHIVLAEKFVGEGRVAIPPVYRTIPPSEGDLLTRIYTFVAPLGEFEEQSASPREDFVAGSRGSSPTLCFRPGATAIDPRFRDNAGSLECLAEAVAALRAAGRTGGSKISHIVVAGYSSPEGVPALNRHLAYLRAKALRDSLAGETGIDPAMIDIHNGGADWAGLRLRVERSDMPEKDDVLALIGDGADITDDRAEELCAGLRLMNGGRTYNRLLTQIFPELRTAACLRIYYEDIGDR